MAHILQFFRGIVCQAKGALYSSEGRPVARTPVTVEYRALCEQEGIEQEDEETLKEYMKALEREGYIITNS